MSKASLCGDPDCSMPYEFCKSCVQAEARPLIEAELRERIARDIEALQISDIAARDIPVSAWSQFLWGESCGIARAAAIARGGDA